MNPDLLSASVSIAFMAIVAAALLAHLSQLASRRRLLHGLYAVTAAGLFYLFGEKALGWSFIPREALLAVYAALFVTVAGMALLRRIKGGGEQIPWIGLMIEQAAMAYIFAPVNYWKPPLAALLFLYFLLELVGWIRGSEEAVPQTGEDIEHRPPLYPPKRVRGLKEVALAGAAAALVYVFAAGTARVPEGDKAEETAAAPVENAESQTAEAPAAPEESAPAEAAQAPEAATPEESKPAQTAQAPEAATPPAGPAAPADAYTAKAGETLKTIARKLYGKADKLKALAQANPGVKPTAKLKAGQVIKLPEPSTKR